jgi:hypothetical protein
LTIALVFDDPLANTDLAAQPRATYLITDPGWDLSRPAFIVGTHCAVRPWFYTKLSQQLGNPDAWHIDWAGYFVPGDAADSAF